MGVVAGSPLLAGHGNVTQPVWHTEPGDGRCMVTSAAGSGWFVPLVALPSAQDITGAEGNSVAADVVYGNSWVIPAEIDRGLLYDAESVLVAVWNADRVNSRTLTTRTENGDGIELAMDTPQHLAPDAEAAGVLSLLADGPAEQETAILFDLGNFSIWLNITFQRVLPFPVRHNWRDRYGYTLAFETAISRSRLADEQRRPLTNKPTRTISMTATARGLHAQRLRNIIVGGDSRILAVPLHLEELAVVDVDETRTVWTVAGADLSTLWNLRRLPGMLMFLTEDGGFMRELSGVDVDNSTITTTQPGPEGVWPVVSVAPAMCAVISRATPAAITDELEEWSLELAEYAGGNQPDLTGVPELPARIEPNADWATRPGTALAMARDLISYPGGTHALYSLYDRNAASIEYAVCEPRSGLFELLDLFAAARGRWRAFWHRDLVRAFTAAREHVATEAVLDVLDNGFELTRPGDERVRLVAAGAEPVTCRIVSLSRAGGVLRLVLDSPLGVACGPGCLFYREYRARFDMDTLTVNYAASCSGTASLRVTELIQEYDA
jgi:hypothetical protein